MFYHFVAVLLALTNALPSLTEEEIPEIQEVQAVSQPIFVPGVVSIQSKGSHVCTGALVNPTTVITDVQCNRHTANSVSVVLFPSNKPEHLQADKKLIFKVNTVYTNTGDPFTVWKVEVIVGNPSILPATVQKLDDGKYSDQGYWITSVKWNLATPSKFKTEMLATKVQIVPVEFCKIRFNGVKHSDICAVQFGPTRQFLEPIFYDRAFLINTVAYDPLDTGTIAYRVDENRQLVLVGLTSNARCIFQNHPCLFSRISSSRYWIEPLLRADK